MFIMYKRCSRMLTPVNLYLSATIPNNMQAGWVCVCAASSLIRNTLWCWNFLNPLNCYTLRSDEKF